MKLKAVLWEIARWIAAAAVVLGYVGIALLLFIVLNLLLYALGGM